MFRFLQLCVFMCPLLLSFVFCTLWDRFCFYSCLVLFLFIFLKCLSLFLPESRRFRGVGFVLRGTFMWKRTKGMSVQHDPVLTSPQCLFFFFLSPYERSQLNCNASLLSCACRGFRSTVIVTSFLLEEEVRPSIELVAFYCRASDLGSGSVL